MVCVCLKERGFKKQRKETGGVGEDRERCWMMRVNWKREKRRRKHVKKKKEKCPKCLTCVHLFFAVGLYKWSYFLEKLRLPCLFPKQWVLPTPPPPLFFFLLGPLTLCLTFLFLFIVFVVLLEGLDAVQIAVANRDRLSSPPFINKSLQLGRLSAATEEQQAGLHLYFEALSVCLSSFSVHCFLFKTSLCCFPLSSPSQFPPSLLSLSSSLLLKPQWGRTTDSLLCVNLSGKQCVCVCVHASSGNTSF